MTDLVLRRSAGFRDILRAYRIFVDGRKVGKINRNSEIRIPVSAGKHTVQLKIDWCSSPELVVSVPAELPTVLECGPNFETSYVYPFTTGDPSSYIWLDVADRGHAGTSSRSSRNEKGERIFEGQKRGPYPRSESTDSGQNEEREAGTPSARPTRAAWHKILQVPPGSSMEDIRCAYRHRMSEYHPDKVAQLGEEICQVADRKSKEINAAYEEASRQHQGR
jgi:hypothetical protein